MACLFARCFEALRPSRDRDSEFEDPKNSTMAWRFQASKFKNTTPKPPKKEATIFDLPIGNLSCTNNGIQTSDSYLAFHIEGEGGKLGVVTTNTRGRRLRDNIGVVCAHGEQVDDFSFLPFAQDLLLTCSRDEKVKLWRISGDSAVNSSLETELDLGGVQLDCLRPHSTASGIVAVAGLHSGFVVDLEQKKTVYELGGITDRALSADWSPDGKLLAVSGDKGKQICIYDPRTGTSPISVFEAHQGMGREGRVLFCGDRLLSSGFTNKRVQEVRLFDTGKWSAPVHTQEFVSTTGVLIPHYDPDTKLVFLTGKGTNKMFMVEQQDRQPLLSNVYEMTLPEQSVGACLSTKRHLNVMEGEVDVFYQLTKNSIVPIPCIVPRRTYRDFHTDLFPNTVGAEAGLTGTEWLSGQNKLPAKISLVPTGSNPSPPPQEPTPPKSQVQTVVQKPVQTPAPVATARMSRTEVEEPAPPVKEAPKASPEDVKEIDYASYEPKIMSNPAPHSPETQKKLDNIDATTARSNASIISLSSRDENLENVAPATPQVKLRPSGPPDSSSRVLSARARPKSCVVGMVASKFRHVETIVGIKANNSVFMNLRNVNTRLPPESNGACASGQFVAVPLSGPAGIVGIYNVDEPGKIPDGVMDGVFNKANVTDMQWNPFNDGELAVGTDAGLVNIWRVSVEDGVRNEMEPAVVLKLGGEKILTLRWHPLASNLLAIALSDNSIELWDTERQERKNKFTTHSGSILSIAWSATGLHLASLGKDSLLNIHEPQLGADCLIRQKKVLDNTRAARVLFACDDRAVVVVGFTRGSERTVQLIDAFDLKVLHTHHVDSGTQPLVPHYDYDSNVLFLAGKGDRILNMFEVCYDSPFMLQLTNYVAPAGAQTIAFHNKKKCDVMAVEFQRGWRLTDKALELMIFRVPRVRKDVFQSDLFPDALVTWRPTMTADEWLSGESRPPQFQSLRPEGVSALTSPATPAAPALARRSAFPEDVRSTPKAAPSDDLRTLLTQQNQNGDEKKEVEKEVQSSWSSQITKDTALEQDRMEGVAEEEWS